MPHEATTGGGAPAAELALSVNGQSLRSAAPTLHELLAERGLDPARGEFACALNGCFVPRAQWPAQRLADGDCVDIVAPVVGG
jgi:sulfur carrier protein